MKKIFIPCVVLAFWSCNNSTNRTDAHTDSTHVTYDASKADTTSVPNGITSGEPISTDTAAYNAEDSGQ